MNYEPSDDLETRWCTECGEECYVVKVDNGIRPYEACGMKGVHHQYEWVSNCCEAPVSLSNEE